MVKKFCFKNPGVQLCFLIIVLTLALSLENDLNFPENGLTVGGEVTDSPENFCPEVTFQMVNRNAM